MRRMNKTVGFQHAKSHWLAARCSVQGEIDFLQDRCEFYGQRPSFADVRLSHLHALGCSRAVAVLKEPCVLWAGPRKGAKPFLPQ